MDEIHSQMVGSTDGYRFGRVFRLEGGSAWEQLSERSEFVLRDRPRVCVWRDEAGIMTLDLEGRSGVVRVRRWVGKRLTGPGAY